MCYRFSYSNTSFYTWPADAKNTSFYTYPAHAKNTSFHTYPSQVFTKVYLKYHYSHFHSHHEHIK